MDASQLRGLLDQMSDPFLRLDARQRILDTNQAFTWLLGYEAPAVAGHRLEELVHPKDQALLVERLQASLDPMAPPEMRSASVTFLTQSGEEIPLDCHLERPAGEAPTLVLLVDRRPESAMDQVHRRFASLVHHELRTPLTSILGAARLLQSGAGGADEDRRLVALLARNSHRLAKLVDTLLDLHSLSLGELPVRLEVFELHPELETIVGRIGTGDLAGPRRVHLSSKPGLCAHGDCLLLHRVLEELFAHSRELGWYGAVNLETHDRGRETHLYLWADDPPQRSTSTGPPETHDAIDTMSHGHDQGLGLSLARALLEAMGGKMLLDHPTGKPAHCVLRLLKTAPVADSA